MGETNFRLSPPRRFSICRRGLTTVERRAVGSNRRPVGVEQFDPIEVRRPVVFRAIRLGQRPGVRLVADIRDRYGHSIWNCPLLVRPTIHIRAALRARGEQRRHEEGQP